MYRTRQASGSPSLARCGAAVNRRGPGMIERDLISVFLDDLAALTAAHGIVLDTYRGQLCAYPVPPGRRTCGGYAAALRPGDYWEVFPYEAGTMSSGSGEPNERMVSVEISSVSAHQRVALRAALKRARDVLRRQDGGCADGS
jgi:hypothetical protein